MEFVFFVAIIVFLAFYYFQSKRKSQLNFIENFRFNAAVKQKVKAKYPHLTDPQLDLVIQGLRDYFFICHQAKRRMVAMPSQVVDVAWHEFILFTRAYQSFCKKALGYFLHHTPTEAMKTPTLAQEGIKRAWRLACYKEGIRASNPAKLPLIFALDEMLSIEDGFAYSLNCKDKTSPAYGDKYCASHIGCTSGCGGDSGASSSKSGGIIRWGRRRL